MSVRKVTVPIPATPRNTFPTPSPHDALLATSHSMAAHSGSPPTIQVGRPNHGATAQAKSLAKTGAVSLHVTSGGSRIVTARNIHCSCEAPRTAVWSLAHSECHQRSSRHHCTERSWALLIAEPGTGGSPSRSRARLAASPLRMGCGDAEADGISPPGSARVVRLRA